MEQVRRHKDDFARVAPFLISDVLVGFQHGTLYPAIKTNILSGTHKLLDIADKHSKEYLTGTLPDGTREIFKQILQNYNQYHKYTGKV